MTNLLVKYFAPNLFPSPAPSPPPPGHKNTVLRTKKFTNFSQFHPNFFRKPRAERSASARQFSAENLLALRKEIKGEAGDISFRKLAMGRGCSRW